MVVESLKDLVPVALVGVGLGVVIAAMAWPGWSSLLFGPIGVGLACAGAVLASDDAERAGIEWGRFKFWVERREVGDPAPGVGFPAMPNHRRRRGSP